MKHRAFTLIELLIVVAIIGILAAIAIPNFQNALIRTRVAKVKSDLRAITMAFDAYLIDYRDLPRSHPYAVPSGEIHAQWIPYRLTTPVLYLSSDTLPDPFAENHYYRHRAYGGSWERYAQEYADKGFGRGVIVVSVGPNKEGDVLVTMIANLVKWNEPASYLLHGKYSWMIYMPTNGVHSGGDIGRVTGEYPVGIPVQIGG